MTKEKFSPLLFLLRKFVTDEGGTILVQFTIYIVAAMGMIGLALDGGRFLLLHNTLQQLADAAALAGAAQLDGRNDAQTRATSAAQAVADSNPPRWYDVGGSTDIGTPVFYSSLDPDHTTTDPKVSNYIQVTTASSQTAPSFLSAVKLVTRSTVSNNTATATAVAQGNDTAACVPIQSFICNPFEAAETNPGIADNFSSNVSVGTMVLLVNGAGAAGNWGLLDPPPPLSTNPHDQASFWAQSSVGGSCVSGGPGGGPGDTRTGNVAKFAVDGMNIRFDQPAPNGDGIATADDVAAPIVIDGLTSTGTGNSCNNPGPVTPPSFDPNNYSATCNSTTPTSVSCPLPRDRTFTTAGTGTPAWSGAFMGNGLNLTDLSAYWQNHHSGSLPAGVTTRYQTYQQEVSGTAAFTAASDAVEPHAPVCVPNSNNAARRLINVAVVDCHYWGITGKKPLPTAFLYAQFFMTEPAASDGSIYGEYLGSFPASTSGNPGGGPHKIVRLVR